MQKQKRNAKRTAQGTSTHFAAHIITAVVAGLAAAAVFFCALASFRCKVDLAPQLLSPISTTAFSLAVLFAGLVLASLRKEKGVLYGLMMGGIFFMVLWIAALAQGQKEFSALSAIKGAALLFSGAIGGFCGILLQERRRRIHK